MSLMQARDRYVGYSKIFSFDQALEDAAQQARGQMPDAQVDFTVVGIRGRIGGIGGVRDLWVEIRVGGIDDAAQDTEPRYTTMALGEEGGEAPGEAEPTTGIGAEDGQGEEQYTTMALGEEGGEAPVEYSGPEQDTMRTTMALGEEGGAV
jgi:flavin-binding protein dodecin